jgi:hypothetical protein
MTDNDQAVDDQLLVQSFARLQASALGTSLGAVTAAALFLATAVLRVRSMFDPPDAPLGPHLALLANYFPGYTVSWPGAFVGAAYGFACGWATGVVVAFLLNLSHFLYIRILERKLRSRAIYDGL